MLRIHGKQVYKQAQYNQGVTYELRRVENVLTTLVDRTRVRSADLLGEKFLRFENGKFENGRFLGFLEACGEGELRWFESKWCLRGYLYADRRRGVIVSYLMGGADTE